MTFNNTFNFPIINDPSMAEATATNLSTSLATKDYVDAVATGLTIKVPCVASTTANLTAIYNNGAAGIGATLTNSSTQVAFSTDGVSPALNGRVLVQFQTDETENGIYTLTTVGTGATNWVLTRATDYDTPVEIAIGDLVLIRTGGTLYGGTGWVEASVVTTIGTDPISFIQFSASLPLKLANGGTSANLTAANGAVPYSTASAMAFLAPTVTANQMFQSGSSTVPHWSTTTWPATSTVNQLLFSSAANVISGLATAASSVLITSAGGIPSLGLTLPAGVQANITALGTIATGLWHGTLIGSTYGGTGVNNGASTFTMGGNTAFNGAYTFTGTLTGPTSVIFPLTGTLATTSANVGTAVLHKFTTSGNYTPSSGMVYCIVHVTGGGGGGGGTKAIASAGNSGAGGGGSGSTSWAVYSAADIGVSQAFTIGAGGIAGTVLGSTGGTGGASVFGALITTTGGLGGTGCTQSAALQYIAGGAGGAAGTGSGQNNPGSPGSPGFSLGSASVSGNSGSGSGAPSFYQGGGAGVFAPNSGIAGTAPGSGGSGSASTSASSLGGGTGAPGYITVLEFIVT